MNDVVRLSDERDAADLGTFLARATRLGASSVRLAATGGVLAVTVCARSGSGLMGEGTVLGLRAFRLAEEASCDVVVAIDAVQDRLARLRSTSAPGPQALAIPPVPMVEAWAGLSAPRSGWEPATTLDGALLTRIATGGIAEVAAAPDAMTRDAVWGRVIPGTSIPTSAALAVHALGFTAAQHPVFVHGRWHRIASPAGHVLTR